ncbi:MAG: helix-turn-helix domain-containing protein [Clostridia bacterium]|nr:helix-turn-helix domain-containing protein [Clostridia bacterium]
MKSTTQQILGQRIALLRTASGMSQEQIANVLHISRSTYAYYESGKSSPSLDSLRTLIQMYCPDNPEFLLLMDKKEDHVNKKLTDSLKKEKLKGTLLPDEIQLLAYYRSASVENREKLLKLCLSSPKKK